MPSPTPLDAASSDAPLRGVAVVEFAGELCGYAGRLLADLGATVTRVRLGGTATGCDVMSEAAAQAPAVDVDALFVHRDKIEVVLDPATEAGRDQLARIVAASDIVLQPGGAEACLAGALAPETVTELGRDVIQVVLTPFGLSGPHAGYASTDLVRLAAGGLLWLGGYPDTEPVAPYGEQSTLATGIFGAVAALLALLERDRTGRGQMIEVSAQEVLTQALETSIPEYEITGNVRRRMGTLPREAGTGVFPCADGLVSVVAGRLGTSRAWSQLRQWLVEEDAPGAEKLWEERWDDLAFRQRPASITRFSEIFEAFAMKHSRQELYLEAQRRNIALAPVNTPADVLVDRQLSARGFFMDVCDGNSGLIARIPSPPYRFLRSSIVAEPTPVPAVSSAGISTPARD